MMNSTVLSAEIKTDSLRIQVLSPDVIRLEEKGAKGFEDRETFLIQNRTLEGSETLTFYSEDDREKVYETGNLYIHVPHGAKRLSDVTLRLKEDGACWKAGRLDAFTDLPVPSELPAFWVLPDRHRVIPSKAGALPIKGDHPDSGWEVYNDARDLYVFLPASSGYEEFRREFLALTGPVPMPPLYAFGLWYSRYHPYSDRQALKVIDTFREKAIPLDVFVVDTDWRVGASHGYQVNTDLFPDMRDFIEKAHAEGVRVVFNDHPEPAGRYALDPKEMQYRWEGLTSLLEMGMDAWWFDRNWHTHLHGVNAALRKEVWGMRLYHDITQAYRTEKRPLIMSNADGIDNGRLDYPTHPAAHRYPIWWTGDTLSNWQALEQGIRNGVEAGIYGLLPYVHEDLGGHIGDPDAELYLRFLQFGVFSPVARLHCTCGTDRYPWRYGKKMEEIVAEYVRLRYRLMPVIYAAAYRAWKEGEPILRRCDLAWPEEVGASGSLQYLFGDDLLVAPFFEPAEKGRKESERTIWVPPGEWENAWTGEVRSGPMRLTVRKPLAEMPLFIRRGGILFEAPLCQKTDRAAWAELTVHLYPNASEQGTMRLLYEDDGDSTGYQSGAGKLTEVEQVQTGSEVHVDVRPMQQGWKPPFDKRDWTFCMHPGQGRAIESVSLVRADGTKSVLPLQEADDWIPGVLRNSANGRPRRVPACTVKEILLEQGFALSIRLR